VIIGRKIPVGTGVMNEQEFADEVQGVGQMDSLEVEA
jgi:hypothetical protein